MTINDPGVSFYVNCALKARGCQSSMQIVNDIKRIYGKSFSVGAVSAELRKMIKEGKAASSKDENLKSVYWMTDFGKESFIKENNHA